jgi:hypothetical protein
MIPEFPDRHLQQKSDLRANFSWLFSFYTTRLHVCSPLRLILAANFSRYALRIKIKAKKMPFRFKDFTETSLEKSGLFKAV